MEKQFFISIINKSSKVPKQDDKTFWSEFDRLAASSSDEVLPDEVFQRTNISRKLELV
jgi:hypothetical protein